MTESFDESSPLFGDVLPDAVVERGAALAQRIRKTVDFRRARVNFLPSELFGEPAWDMLLDLYIAESDGKRISVSSACIASGVPATTALRWLSRMEEMGLIKRTSDHRDKRRIYVAITQRAQDAINEWLIRAVIE